jgi:predicted nucleic acid-binding protein
VILPDTSIWVDHFRATDPDLSALLTQNRVAVHPFVVGEMALGNVRNRATVLGWMEILPKVDMATSDEVLFLIQKHGLGGSGLGLIDAHLLASALLTPGLKIWTRDKKLDASAGRMGVAARPPF